jgi:hypothetical protein
MHDDSRPTVEDAARAALAAVDSQAGIIVASQWVSERYQQLAARTTLRHLRRLGTVTIPGVVTTGTVEVTQGSAIVEGDATAVASWSMAMVGRQFQVDKVWYTITGMELGREDALLQSRLYLEPAYAEATNAAATYKIVAQYIALPAAVRKLGEVRHMDRRLRLLKMSLGELDRLNPERLYLTLGPQVCVDFGDQGDGRRLLEVYPYSADDEGLHFDYTAKPEKLELKDPLPPDIDLYVLKEGVLVDVYRHQAAVSARAGKVDQAQYWQSESVAREVIWDNKLREAIQQDRRSDDLSFMLRSSNTGILDASTSAISTAASEIYARGARP